MRILVLGGTRFFGRHLAEELLKKEHQVIIATRGRTPDPFGCHVERMVLDRTNEDSLAKTLDGRYFDAVVDDLAYCSMDVKRLLDHLDCGRYVMTSSAAVYELHMDVREEEFRPETEELLWRKREELNYAEGKRQAECALVQCYSKFPTVRVRYPVVLGRDDYTKRLAFYINHVLKEIPMMIDNLDSQLCFIRSDEAGKLLAHLTESGISGAVNGCSAGTVSLREIIEYVEMKTGKMVILAEDGEMAPYNGICSNSLNTEKAMQMGFMFTELKSWIFDLIDFYIESEKAEWQYE